MFKSKAILINYFYLLSESIIVGSLSVVCGSVSEYVDKPVDLVEDFWSGTAVMSCPIIVMVIVETVVWPTT